MAVARRVSTVYVTVHVTHYVTRVVTSLHSVVATRVVGARGAVAVRRAPAPRSVSTGRVRVARRA